MHGVFGAAGPIADPFESGLAEDGNYPSIHVARRALRVIFAIKINGDSPTVSGELFSRALWTEGETSAEAEQIRFQSLGPYFAENIF